VRASEIQLSCPRNMSEGLRKLARVPGNYVRVCEISPIVLGWKLWSPL
jgi:hypothetical protein